MNSAEQLSSATSRNTQGGHMAGKQIMYVFKLNASRAPEF